jgi:hypothetical protein
MPSKFDRPEAWQALEAEEREYWARRSVTERAASVLALAQELLAVQREGDARRAEAADRARRADKLQGWILLKERLRCPSASRRSSRTSSAER